MHRESRTKRRRSGSRFPSRRYTKLLLTPRARRFVGLTILGAGVLLLASLLLPWYSISLPSNLTGSFNSSSNGSYRESFAPSGVAFQYPPPPTTTCALSPPANCSSGPASWSESYSAARLPDLGSVYLYAAVMVGVAGAIAVVSGAVLLFGRSKLDRTPAMMLIVLVAAAAVLAVAGPLFVALEQPATVSTDWSRFAPTPFGGIVPVHVTGGGCQWLVFGYGGTGVAAGVTPTCPGSAFTGSDPGTGASWGPSWGWFAAVLAGVLLGVASVLQRGSLVKMPQRTDPQ